LIALIANARRSTSDPWGKPCGAPLKKARRFDSAVYGPSPCAGIGMALDF